MTHHAQMENQCRVKRLNPETMLTWQSISFLYINLCGCVVVANHVIVDLRLGFYPDNRLCWWNLPKFRYAENA